jgi:outer membrane lipoprotein-sorting protein
VKMVLEKEMPDRLGAADPNQWVQRFLSCQYKELGQKTIDGVLCEGLETTDPAFFGGGNPPEPSVARLWVSVETGYPVRFESERVYDGARHTSTQDRFQWDADLDGSLFEPNIPAGYLDISPY